MFLNPSCPIYIHMHIYILLSNNLAKGKMPLVEGAPAIMDQHLGSSPANFGIQQAGSNRKFENLITSKLVLNSNIFCHPQKC